MSCEAEDCPFWTGDGCACQLLDLDDSDRRRQREANGWDIPDGDYT